MLVRSKVKKLKVTLTVPCDESLQRRLRMHRRLLYHSDQVDWFYPIRGLKALGFGKLELLKVEAKSELPAEAPGLEQLIAWVNG